MKLIKNICLICLVPTCYLLGYLFAYLRELIGN